MEHGIDLKYSIAHFEREIKYINELLKYMKLEHQVAKKLIAKRNNYEKCLNILCGHEEQEYNPELVLTSLRSHLYYLEKQIITVPETQKIIDEINYVTKILKDGKS